MLAGCRAIVPAPLGDPAARLHQARQQVTAITAEWKSGATRADLEREFKQDGGIMAPNPQRYVYKAYPEIKIDVVFDFENGKEKAGDQADYWSNPKDRIKMTSKPYSEHPFYD